MATLYSTGPANMFIQGANTGGRILYLGTAKKAPKIIVRRGWTPVMNDLAGQVIPMDTSYQGQEAFAFSNFTRLNLGVYQLLASSPTVGSQLTPGTDGPGDNGALLLAEGLAWTLFVQFPYNAKRAFSSNNLPPGYRFLACSFEGPDEFGEIGTNPLELATVFHAYRVFNPQTGRFTCYDFNLGTLPPIN